MNVARIVAKRFGEFHVFDKTYVFLGGGLGLCWGDGLRGVAFACTVGGAESAVVGAVDGESVGSRGGG